MTFGEAKDLLLEQDLDAEVQVLVVYVMGILKETYAPTITMTQNQKNTFDMAKQNLETSELANVVEYQGSTYSKLDALSGQVWGHKQGEATDTQIKKAMQAWLHPELVKVVD